MSASVGGVGVGTKGGPAGQRRWRREAGRARWGRGLAGLGVVLALLLGGGPVSAKTIDTIPADGLVIEKQGRYNVTHDLSYGGNGPAILITASRVVLDLRGYSVSGGTGNSAPAAPTSGIQVQGAQEVTVQNGTISGFSVGISLVNCVSVTMENNTLRGNGDTAISLSNSHSNTIENNTASNNGAGGIRLIGCGKNTIQNNTVVNNGGGISVSGSNHTIQNNIASANGRFGIAVSGSSNTIQSNTALNPAGGSFYYDLYDNNLTTACGNTWTGNTFAKDNESGSAFGPGAGCIQ